MKIMSVIAAAVLSLTSYHAVAKPVDIPEKTPRWIVRDDGGGNVEMFKQSLKYLADNNMAIKLGGICASACTLILSKDYKLDVCITPDIKLGFHQPYAMDGMGRIHYTIPFIVAAEKIWKTEFLAKYPDWVQEQIKKNGGVPAVYKGHTPSSVLWMDYSVASKHMKTC